VTGHRRALRRSSCLPPPGDASGPTTPYARDDVGKLGTPSAARPGSSGAPASKPNSLNGPSSANGPPYCDGQRARHQFALLRQLAADPDYDPFQPHGLVDHITRKWRGL
jgi:hypothetical protein